MRKMKVTPHTKLNANSFSIKNVHATCAIFSGTIVSLMLAPIQGPLNLTEKNTFAKVDSLLEMFSFFPPSLISPAHKFPLDEKSGNF